MADKEEKEFPDWLFKLIFCAILLLLATVCILMYGIHVGFVI